MTNKFNALIQQCINEVNDSLNHNLSFKARRYLLEAFNEVASGDWSGSVDITNAHFIRAQLAILCAYKVLPVWEQNIVATHPHRILQKSEAYFNGSLDYDDLDEDIIEFNNGLNNASNDKEMIAYPVGRTITAAAFTVIDDEIIMDKGLSEDQKNDPQDSDYFDCAYWASIAYSSDNHLDVVGSDSKKNLKFWEWYLKEAIPSVLSMIKH
jgi:hypothetical protein